jgi:hypothetical protein
MDGVESRNKSQRRAIWLKRMHEWHWISSAIALLGLLFFSLTGITLNHADSFESGQQAYTAVTKPIPADLLASLQVNLKQYGEGTSVPTEPLRLWIDKTFGVDTAGREADWKSDEIDFSLERPGGDAWLKLDLTAAKAEYHVSSAGWIAFFNDLHKGRHTGPVWAWFIDIMAAACVIFAVTGFVILKMHAVNRPLTWPMVALGLLLPFVLIVLWIH